MSRLNLIAGSLWHCRRMYLGVAAGVLLATAVLTGALLCGDSVRGTLRTIALLRLGGIDVAVGSTAVSAPKYYAYVEAGQAVGVMGGMKGASEYEELVELKYPELAGLERTATMGMDVQSIVHLVIIFFILFGNVMYVLTRRVKEEVK